MLKILSIAWNDIKIEFSEMATLVFFLILPIVFTGVIGAGMQNLYTGGDDQATDDRIPVVVVDEDQTEFSSMMLEILGQGEVVRPFLSERDQARALYDDGQVPAILTIPRGFQARLLDEEAVDVDLLESPSDGRALAIGPAIEVAANHVGAAVAIAHASLNAAERIRPLADDQARETYFRQGLQLALDQLGDPPASVRLTAAPQAQLNIGSSFDQSSAGQMVTWVLITLIGASEVFVNERLGGTLRRLLVTPVSKATILSGKILGRLSMGIVQMAMLVVVGATVFGVNWGRSPTALALMLLAFGLAAVSMGVLLGTLVKTRGQASGMVIMTSMVTAALGGCWWPLEITPPAYQVAVKVLPTTWAMQGLKNVIVRGSGVSGILPQVGVLLAFALAFFAVGIWRFRFE